MVVKQNRPKTTLFLIQSLDGKISTGDVDTLDVDLDFKRIKGVKEGLHQYYEIEQTTDLVSFNSGRVQQKVGVNSRDLNSVEKTPISFVVVDNKPHLTQHGCKYFAKRSKVFYLITTNKKHPAYTLMDTFSNIKILHYEKNVDFVDVFKKFKEQYGVKRITIQTGGTLNAEFLRLKLIDQVSIVIAPCLIGGSNTQSLIGGESLHSQIDLQHIKPLKLVECKRLKNSYLHIKYKVINDTHVE